MLSPVLIGMLVIISFALVAAYLRRSKGGAVRNGIGHHGPQGGGRRLLPF